MLLSSKQMFRFFFLRFLKKFIIGLPKGPGGRNFHGRICVYHQGGGKRRRIRILDRFRRLNQVGVVLKIFKHGFGKCYLGIVLYENGLLSLITLTSGIEVGDSLYSGDLYMTHESKWSNGSAIQLKNFCLFTVISSFELFPLSGFKYARAAGASSYVIGDLGEKVLVKMSSGWHLKIPGGAMAVCGAGSNRYHRFIRIRKAGIQRALGRRPTVRGVVKNPCDHPHGGGEGKGSPPVAQKTPWGKLTKGTPTKNKKSQKRLRRLYKHYV